MRVLALDTALGAASAGIFDFPEGAVLAQRSQAMERGHAEALIPMVEGIVGEIEGGFGSLDRIAVTVGPGSFTGLRVAIAAARAFALAMDIPVVGVSTLVAYAAPLLASGSRATVGVAIDARHGSVFFQSFWLDGRKAFGPALVTIDQAVTELRGGPARLTGSGAALVAAAAGLRGVEAQVVSCNSAPDIAFVARLGAAADPALAPSSPLYLRAASAMPQTGGRIARA